jgi:catalase
MRSALTTTILQLFCALNEVACGSQARSLVASQQNEVTAEEVVTALEGAYGVHPGERRNHTKGTCALGTFVGMAEAVVYSRSSLFSGHSVPVIARFSLAGGNPEAPDAEKSPRGMALEFRLPNGGLQHMTMINTPMFFAAVPPTFLDKMRALKPDPATGKPDPETFKAFLDGHPDNRGQAEFLANNNPPKSYANSAYYGIHTFKFINRDNKNMLLTIGEPGDPQDDPTILWPKDRKELKVGTLSISSAMAQPAAGCGKINFDPLVMSDGIAPTNDPVLLFRSPSYALSFTKRLQGK